MPPARSSSRGFGRASLLALFGLTSLSSACAEQASADERPKVVATTGMIADITRRIAGERIQVVALMGPDVDPHLFTPTRSDVLTLQSADLVLYNGLHLEGRLDDTFEELREDGIAAFAVVEELRDSATLTGRRFTPIGPGSDSARSDALSSWDPHVWMDPSAWADVALLIGEALVGLDPDQAHAIRARSREVRAELLALHAWAARCLSTVPTDRRLLITSHDAFNYFGRAYDLEVRGIQGISTDSEAGLADINDLVDLVVERRIPAVFAESSVPARNVEALSEGARERGFDVAFGGELFSDAMGPEGEKTGTYVGMLEHNVRTVVSALGGHATPFDASQFLQTAEERAEGKPRE